MVKEIPEEVKQTEAYKREWPNSKEPSCTTI